MAVDLTFFITVLQDSAMKSVPHKIRKAFAIAGIALVSVVVIAVALLAAATWWLSPERLTRLVNEKASEYLDADVRASDIRFTIWSSFPHFHVSTDSVTVVSRTLRGVPDSVRQALPSGCDSLVSLRRLRGSVNVRDLIAGRISLRDVVVDSLRVNLVAYNDSIDNYSILPSDPHRKMEVPEIEANLIQLGSGGRVDYYSAAASTAVRADIDSAYLVRTEGRDDSYYLELDGKTDLTVEKLRVLDRFPFRFGGTVELDFKPLRTAFRDCSVNIGNVMGKLNLSLDLGEKPSVKDFTYHADTFDLMRLLAYLPKGYMPYLEKITAALDVRSSATLTSPYVFSADGLPSMLVSLDVDRGNVSYAVSDGERYMVSDIAMHGELDFNGRNPDSSRFRLTEFRMRGEGSDINATAEVSELTGGSPLVDVRLNCSSDLAKLTRAVSALKRVAPSGQLDLVTAARFRISDISRSGLSGMNVNGNLSIASGEVSPAPDMRLRLGKTDIAFSGSLDSLDDSGIENGLLKLGVSSRNATLKGKDFVVSTGALLLATRNEKPQTIRFGTSHKWTEGLSLLVSAAGLTVDFPRDTVHMNGRNLKGTADVAGGTARLDVSASALDLKKDNLSLAMEGITAGTSVSPDAVAPKTAGERLPSFTTVEDSIGLSIARHTPEYLTAALGEKARGILGRLVAHARLKIDRGRLDAPAFPTVNTFSGLDVSTNIDSVLLRNIRLRSGVTSATINGALTGLRGFLVSETPQRLRADMNISIDTLSVNNLARTYEDGVAALHGGVMPAKKPKPEGVSGSDTVTLLIPRNIDATLRVSAKEAIYTNLHLCDLNTRIDVGGGDAFIRNLHIGSDFGNACLDFAYTTSDIENMAMKLNLDIRRIDMVRFFQNFPKLLKMMPSMGNLSGFVSADVSGGVMMFPNMYLDMPSLHAYLDVEGRELKVRQDKFIRRVTRMLLVRNSDDIHIANMNVHASVHDNLLEVYPFSFEFDRYKLRLGGVNNFNGNLYYHIGVLRSPVPFPFGVNIQGMLEHPLLRFGGASFNIDRCEDITRNIMDGRQVNLSKELKYYFGEFIHKAALADTVARK